LISHKNNLDDRHPIESRFKPNSKPVQTLFKPNSKPVQTLFKPSSKPVQTLFKPSSKPVQTLFKPSSKPVQTAFSSAPGCAPMSGPGCAPMSGPGCAPVNAPGCAPVNAPGCAPKSGKPIKSCAFNGERERLRATWFPLSDERRTSNEADGLMAPGPSLRTVGISPAPTRRSHLPPVSGSAVCISTG